MDIRQLKYFLAVADTRSFVNASQVLYISRQAISKAISQLEEELGVELFMRDSNGAFLTPAGIVFYDRVGAIVRELDSLRDDMQRYGSCYCQRVRLAFSVGTTRLYESALSAFKETQRNVQIEYRESPEEICLQLLREHQVDSAICTTEPADPLFTAEEVYRSRFGVYLRKTEQISDLDDVDLADLSWIPLAGITGQTMGVDVDLQYSGYDYHRLFMLAREGKCALLLPECLVPKDCGDMCWLPIQKELWWKLYQVRLQSLEKNLLYCAILDEIQIRVFESVNEREDGVNG